MCPWVEVPGAKRPERPLRPTSRESRDELFNDLIDVISSYTRGLVINVVNRGPRRQNDRWINAAVHLLAAASSQAREAEISTVIDRLKSWNVYGLARPEHLNNKRDLMNVNSLMATRGLETLSRPSTLNRYNGQDRDMVVIGVGNEGLIESFASQAEKVFRPRGFVTVMNPFVAINGGRGAVVMLLYEVREDELSDMALTHDHWSKVRDRVKASWEA